MTTKKKIIMLICVIAILAVGAGIGAYAASVYGTQSDPLVAKSYLDSVFTTNIQTQLQTQIDAKAQELETKINNATGNNTNFTAVTLTAGQAVTCAAGSEIILTSGTAAAAGATLTDVTSGESVAVGGSITLNHLVVVATDSSGVKAGSEGATVLVRGAQTVS